MKFAELPIPGVFRIDLEKREDARGFFARLFCRDEFAAHGLETTWAQMNDSFSRQAGTLRGLHYQRPPHAETKVVRCLRGGIFDVVVDLRQGSKTFGRWHGLELSDENRTMLYIPKGVAHGFQTLRADTELLYFHSEIYAPGAEGGVAYDDPDIGVAWPLEVAEISGRDRAHSRLRDTDPIAP